MPQNTFENGRTGASDMLGHDSMSLEASVVTLEKTATNQSGTSSAPSSLHNGTALYANNSQAHGINQMSLGDMATSEAEDESRWMSYVVDLNTTTGSELPIDRSFSLSSSNMSSEYPSTNFPFDLSMAGTEPSNAGHAFARDSSSKDSRGPGSSTAASDWRKELGKLGADLYELPPAHPHQPVTQSGVWIMLVPKVVDHAKTLYRLANRASSNYTPPPTVTNQSTKQPNKGRLSSEDQLPMDRPTWLILLSCYTRTLQVCRYTLGSIYMTLKTDRGLFAVLQLEGTMMAEDEPHLKILLLLQVLSYRLNTIAAALSLPRQHRLQGSGATGGDRATEKEVSTGTADALAADWALRGDIAERSVFGSPDCKKENITAAFLAEYEIIVGLVSEQ